MRCWFSGFCEIGWYPMMICTLGNQYYISDPELRLNQFLDFQSLGFESESNRNWAKFGEVELKDWPEPSRGLLRSADWGWRVLWVKLMGVIWSDEVGIGWGGGVDGLKFWQMKMEELFKWLIWWLKSTMSMKPTDEPGLIIESRSKMYSGCRQSRGPRRTTEEGLKSSQLANDHPHSHE